MSSVFILWNNESIDLSEIYAAYPTREAAEKARDQAETGRFFGDIVEVLFHAAPKECDCQIFENCVKCNPNV